MYLVNNNYSQISFGHLIPKKDYKGTVLKLTKEDKAKIAVLQKNISDLEYELYRLCRYFEYKKPNPDSDYFYIKADSIRTEIEMLKEEIRNIKTERLKKQKFHIVN